MTLKLVHKKFSTYIAIGIWVATGFMSQPTIASFVVHFAMVPVALALLIIIAHYEGRDNERSKHLDLAEDSSEPKG